MDMGKVVEYDMNGKQLWSVDAPGVWDAEPLANGNVLISGNNNKYVREVNREGETVWEFTAADAPEFEPNKLADSNPAEERKYADHAMGERVEWTGRQAPVHRCRRLK